MSAEEIAELLKLKGWDKTTLAYELGVKENTVWVWMTDTARRPSGPASRLMRDWLAEARAANGRKKVGAK